MAKKGRARRRHKKKDGLKPDSRVFKIKVDLLVRGERQKKQEKYEVEDSEREWDCVD